MKPSALAFPGHKINDYLLVLSPQPTLRNKVLAIKEQLYNVCQAPNARWGKPHITLAACKQYAMSEARLVNKLKAIGMGQQPFNVVLKDCGSFPYHTIYIDVVSKEPVRQLVKAIRLHQECMTLNNANRPYFSDMPHMTLARQLSKEQFENQWPHYSKMPFDGAFMADSMLLLRRPAGIPAAYQLVDKIDFLQQPVDASQAQLFSKQ